MNSTRSRHLVRLGVAALALIVIGCDLGPTSTTTPTPTPIIPSVAPSAQPAPTATTSTQPAPTATKAVQSSPRPSALPTTAATQPPATVVPTQVPYKYPAPQLKEPKKGDGYGGQLIWESLDLAPDEYYHVFVHAIHNQELRHWGFDTALGVQDAKFLLPREQFGDKDNDWKTLSDSGEFSWEVQAMRRLPDGSSVPISPVSETWTFVWERSSD
ncbi:MAG: hypothetical protein KKA73_14045 [Chloroflexi bacterium]|nr:hypothetical protein [Chloroflexota bacterium]MBU1748806.1 hypothetical protein [Chloroflexota bacterium]